MDFMNIENYFRKKTPILPKYIINRDGVAELTLGIDCSLTVAHLRKLLSERLSDLSEDEQFIHSNGAPIHILDEQETIISELLPENSNIIFLKRKLTKNLVKTSNSTELLQNKTVDKSSYLQSSESQYQPKTLKTVNTISSKVVPSADLTVMIKNNSEVKTVPLSELLSNAKLEINNNNLSPTDMKQIVSGLKQNKAVKELKIWSSCCHIIEILVEVLKVNKTLTSLDISFGMNNAECILITNELMSNYTLKKLSLTRNEITFAGCKAIGEMLKLNKTLTHLKICRNKLCDEGIKFICDALLVNRTLCELDIYQTNMSSNGVAYVAQMIQINKTLTLLDIGDNNIRDNDITVIANALKSNTTLIELDVKCNQITEKGGLTLLDMLTTNRTLKTVKLQFNKMPDDVQLQIKKKAPQLQTSGLDLCSII